MSVVFFPSRFNKKRRDERIQLQFEQFAGMFFTINLEETVFIMIQILHLVPKT